MTSTASDTTATIAQLKQWVRDFSQERDWEQFHHPKDLGLALAIEVGELLEHFRYRDNERIAKELAKESVHTELAHELADCLWLLLRLGDVCDVDLSRSLREKLVLAAEKYPADLVRGRSDKYTYYRGELEKDPRRDDAGS
ncbi:hypothetical protein Pan216_14820 [Planctomycetes bacterium Pan216]|uniref:MazG nucleotide pyrophosphohydrolase domain protein n=1 Tax=Kolteria novifilia TaxID=2527975 RepID=A0A518B0Z2_9BACT|nr:hypothetical protein Pan216_14820 [Planctomycetes bacterium Pan216]